MGRGRPAVRGADGPPVPAARGSGLAARRGAAALPAAAADGGGLPGVGAAAGGAAAGRHGGIAHNACGALSRRVRRGRGAPHEGLPGPAHLDRLRMVNYYTGVLRLLTGHCYSCHLRSHMQLVEVEISKL